MISLQSKGLSRVFSNTAIQKASILQHSAFFMVQFSHPYVTTRKTIALTIRTFGGKKMSLLFNTLSRLVIAFLPRNKCLLVSWLQLVSMVDLQCCISVRRVNQLNIYLYSLFFRFLARFFVGAFLHIQTLWAQVGVPSHYKDGETSLRGLVFMGFFSHG